MEVRNYSRKDKSLGLLCFNFTQLYDRKGVDCVGLDDAAARLGVERRRIYDIVNVLESIGVLSRKAKNCYAWIGLSGIPKALENLKQEAQREIAAGVFSPRLNSSSLHNETSDDEEDSKPLSQITADNPPPCKTKAVENRREKSLGLLTQSFVKLFLTSNVETISLDEAARLLLGDGDSSTMRNNAAKVRRLYDIANVLSSMKLIEKTQNSESRKPAFKWIGLSMKSTPAEVASASTQCNKRAFGTDMTNREIKKSKFETLSGEGKQRKTMVAVMKSKSKDLKECNLTATRQLNGSKGYAFGPFCPNNPHNKGGGANEDGEKTTLDWEAMAASFHPRYHNQALSEIFAHYMEAWKSWYVELAQPTDQTLCSQIQGV